jgi:hypothetical protein
VKLNFIVVLGCLISASCASPPIAPYLPPSQNVQAASQLSDKYFVFKVSATAPNLEPLKSGTLPCGDGQFRMPAGKSVLNFIEQSFAEELMKANKFESQGTPVVINVRKLQTTPDERFWILDFNYILGLKQVRVSTSSRIPTPPDLTQCQRTASGLNEALAENFANLYLRIPLAR